MHENILKLFAEGDSLETEIRVERLRKQWHNDVIISERNDRYTLRDKETRFSITQKEAHKLILLLDLKVTPSPVFDNAFTWRPKQYSK